MKQGYMRVLAANELADGAILPAVVDGWPIVLARSEGRAFALLNRCSHAASAFAPDGRMRRGALMCPAHGARFSVDGGTCIGAAYPALRTFPCREKDGWIEVVLPDHAPSADEQPVTRP
ncbi:Rieske (2Fe-2S) protein [Novosphingobium tardum]|uniref:Rieske (2Fe-2S) protein n=1 Tax=Novosphingobium tardum TaxID=1538021 RepID=A0ABV8RT00_9SPHN